MGPEEPTFRPAAIAMALGACRSEPPRCEAPPPDLLVVVLDDVGPDSIAAYGLHPDPPYTPVIDDLASRGVRFDRAYAPPLCSPSRATLLTGRYGRRYGLGTNLPFDTYVGELPRSERTIAEALRARGYHTAAFGKWHLVTRSTPDVRLHPNDQGFDHFDGTLSNLDSAWDESDDRHHDYSHWERVIDGAVYGEDSYAPDVLVDAVTHADLPEPWFLYVGMYLAHEPWHVPPADLQRSGVTADSPWPDLFAAMVEAADTEVGRILAALPDDTTVVVLGDNGEDAQTVRPPWKLRGYKSTLTDGGIRVPLIVAGPPAVAGVSDALVQTVDVTATLADLGCAALDHPDGRSLVPLLRDPEGPGPRDLVYTELFGVPGPPPYRVDQRVVVDRDYKLERDEVTGVDTLRSVGPSPEDESDDLLGGPFPADRYERLSRELDGLEGALAYDRPSGCDTSGGVGWWPMLVVLSFGRTAKHAKGRKERKGVRRPW